MQNVDLHRLIQIIVEEMAAAAGSRHRLAATATPCCTSAARIGFAASSKPARPGSVCTRQVALPAPWPR